MGYFTTPRIAFGPSSIEQLGALGARRAVVVIGPSVAATPHAQHALEELQKAGASVERLVERTNVASLEGVEALAAKVRSFDADWIVAIGGGRTLDTAKGLWLRLTTPDVPLDRVTPLTDVRLREKTRFAAVPTTAGSGSEATWSAFLSAPDGHVVEVAARELAPDWAIVDPTFLATLSTPALAASAAGALVRAVEAFVSPWAGPLTDADSLAAIGTLVAGLGRLDRHRDGDLEAALQLAATQAGVAGANAPGGLGHAIATTVSFEFGLPYGRVTAALLPAVVEFDYPSVRDRLGPLAATFGSSAGTSRSTVSDRIRGALEAARLPRSLAEAGVPVDALEPRLPELVARIQRAPGVSSTPRIPTAEELGRLLRSVARGTPVDY